jgi:hypothetical protein
MKPNESESVREYLDQVEAVLRKLEGRARRKRDKNLVREARRLASIAREELSRRPTSLGRGVTREDFRGAAVAMILERLVDALEELVKHLWNIVFG